MSAAERKSNGGWSLVALALAVVALSYLVGRLDQHAKDRRAVSAFTQRIFISAVACGATEPNTFVCQQLADLSTARPLSKEPSDDR